MSQETDMQAVKDKLESLANKVDRLYSMQQKQWDVVMGKVDTSTGRPVPGLIQNQQENMVALYGDSSTRKIGLIQRVEATEQELKDQKEWRKKLGWTIAGWSMGAGSTMALVFEVLHLIFERSGS